jgi:hypothetical protein
MRSSLRVLAFIAGGTALLATAGCESADPEMMSLRSEISAAQARADAAYELATQADSKADAAMAEAEAANSAAAAADAKAERTYTQSLQK